MNVGSLQIMLKVKDSPVSPPNYLISFNRLALNRAAKKRPATSSLVHVAEESQCQCRNLHAIRPLFMQIANRKPAHWLFLQILWTHQHAFRYLRVG